MMVFGAAVRVWGLEEGPCESAISNRQNDERMTDRGKVASQLTSLPIAQHHLMKDPQFQAPVPCERHWTTSRTVTRPQFFVFSTRSKSPRWGVPRGSDRLVNRLEPEGKHDTDL